MKRTRSQRQQWLFTPALLFFLLVPTGALAPSSSLRKSGACEYKSTTTTWQLLATTRDRSSCSSNKQTSTMIRGKRSGAFPPYILGMRKQWSPSKSSPLSARNDEDDNGATTMHTTKVDDFQRLMGTLYGVAGLAHAADCLVGPSQLLQSAGSGVAFADLPLAGQAYALIWCLAGPVAFGLTRNRATADWGLIQYGVIEVVGAGLLLCQQQSSELVNPLWNALGVQLLVALSYVYSASAHKDKNYG